MEKNCEPKIIKWYQENFNDNVMFNCEVCDESECEHWKEFNEKE